MFVPVYFSYSIPLFPAEPYPSYGGGLSSSPLRRNAAACSDAWTPPSPLNAGGAPLALCARVLCAFLRLMNLTALTVTVAYRPPGLKPRLSDGVSFLFFGSPVRLFGFIRNENLLSLELAPDEPPFAFLILYRRGKS